jgi:branched-chain amino acid transport system substrate-binding protein
MGGDGMKDDAFIKAAGEAGEGVLASTVGLTDAKMTTAAGFHAAYDAAGFADPASPYGAYAYDAANAIIRALPAVLNGQSKPIDARTILSKALATVSFDGSSGKVAFDQYGDTLYPTFTLYVVKSGSWTPFS